LQNDHNQIFSFKGLAVAIFLSADGCEDFFEESKVATMEGWPLYLCYRP